MAAKKPADLSDLVATKGKAAPVANVPPRSATSTEDVETNNVPLNFRVSADLRRRFRVFAANHDLKLNELLRLAFNEYEERHKQPLT
ncbi:hypothetical protein HAP98_12915 [Acidithiobacillus caldus]|jgi:hypothetical protein|uniref:ribbon-helix-helix protein n=1 Tax=Acidithiobacillus caldus TaxID=33059 RepID=UPI001C07C4C6|nr:hypothetical protein [Acidithiobacillus caldus]MBU2781160.1 hypothetical protein [Acidithiobacillus caldus]